MPVATVDTSHAELVPVRHGNGRVADQIAAMLDVLHVRRVARSVTVQCVVAVVTVGASLDEIIPGCCKLCR